MKINTNIAQNLTKDEKEVFSIVKEVISRYTPSTQAFVAGGWTRDKLMGVPSDDIDIMLSNISGEFFAKLVTKHMGIKDAHTIRENPEKSKHIETSKAYIPLSSGKTQEIDFAQARKEIYKDNSRIPDTQPATPQEDAMRRDLTINSIFYNIIENKLEDFTGMGIKDLIANTIRTPMNPLKTFSEDPLRIFRTLRFTAKYNGKIDPETYQAMLDPSLRNDIKQKISKERIGQEFVKILKNPNANYALQLLKDTGLWDDIVAEAIKGTPYSGKMAPMDMPQENVHHKLTLWGHTMEVIKNIIEKYKDAEPEKRITMILAALMHDLGKLYQEIWGESKSHPGSKSYHGHEKESAKMVELILRYLKMEPYIGEVSKLAQYHMKPHTLIDEGGARTLRRFIRKIGEESLNWIDVFNLAVADAYAKDTIVDPNTIAKYKDLEGKLQEALVSLKPAQDTSIKAILDGNEIMQILNIKPGPWMTPIKEFIRELRDENPDITKEEATKKLKEKFQSVNPKDIKQASKEKEKKQECPQLLLINKIETINNLYKEEKYYEIFSIISDLHKKYNNDDNVARLIIKALFRLLLIDKKYKNIDLIQDVLNKSKDNFFDPILCCYAVGILLLLETKTQENIILDIAKRMIKMAPEKIKKVLDLLPQNIYHEKLKNEIEELLK